MISRPLLTFEQYLRVRQVKEARDALPSDKDLAREYGVPVRVIERAISQGLRRYENRLRQERS